jgi:putative ABC transport system permease protein
METLVRDARYAARTLIRSRGFALAALVTLALGIGANTAIFSVVNTVLIQPLPYADPDEIAILWLNNVPEGIDEDITSFPNYTDWKTRSRTFEHMAAVSGMNVNLTTGGDPEQLRAARVTAGFFDVFGVDAALGRTLLAEENEPGRHQVVVMSHGLWTGRFGADPGIVGTTLSLSGNPFTVVGVLPASFDMPQYADLWVPLAPTAGLEQTFQSRGALWLQVYGRLRDGVTVEEAQADMSAIARALEEEYPAQQGYGVAIEPLREELVGDVRPALLVLLGAVGFVLLIACANVANLLLARGAVRQREISVRLALGADRGRVVRQLLTESVVLSLTGGGIGLLVALWAVRALAGASPQALPWLTDVGIDGTVIGFALLASLATGVVFGLAPAFQAGRTALSDTLREGGRHATGAALLDRLRPVLVAAEVGLALVLLVGAGLLLRSFAAMQSVDTGFAAESRLSFRISLPASRYADVAAREQFFQPTLERIQALPGVESAAAVSTLLLSRLPNMGSVTFEGQPPRAPDAPVISVVDDAVLGDFFGTMDIGIVRGRAFTHTDGPDAPVVAVVNETFVRTFLEGEDPIGKRFTPGTPDPEDPFWITIVGVSEDTRRSGVDVPIRPEAFRHYPQDRRAAMQFVVHASGDPTAVVPAIRNIVRERDPELPIAQVATVESLMGDVVATRVFLTRLLTLFSVLAAALAAIGIYGVMAYLVTQRTREMGIRMAIGAQSGDVLGLVLRDAARYVLPGLVVGAIAALALGRFLRSQLFGVAPTDPLTLIGMAVLFAAVAFVASWLPAHRAARTDPMEALRYE